MEEDNIHYLQISELNQNNNQMETESQNKRIRKYLESGKSLTGLDALYMFGCWRLPARINDLKKIGVNIAPTEMIEITSDGKKKHVSRYKLVK